MDSTRDFAYESLKQDKRRVFDELWREYEAITMVLSMFNNQVISPFLNTGTLLNAPQDLDEFKRHILAQIAPGFDWHC